MSFTQMHPSIAQKILEEIQEHGHIAKRMHKIVYLSEVHPNPENLDEVAVVKVEMVDFASDLEAFLADFREHVPPLYPVLVIISIGPLQPDIAEDDLLVPMVRVSGPVAVPN